MSKIDTDTLSYWALACRRASKDHHNCWIQLHDKGLVVIMIAPDGARAEIPIQWSDLAQAGEQRGSIDAIISIMRREMTMRQSIIMPN